jgi:hypothetical protein
MQHFYLLLFILVGFTSCRSKESHHTTTKPIATAEVDKIIDDVIDISHDTIIACKHSNGLIISTDAGKSWTEVNPNLYFKEVAMTDSGYLIGIHSWVGIHEADLSKLYRSKDFGKTWDTFHLDTEKFFPLHFVSSPKEKLLVQTFDNKIYQLNGPDLKTDWTFIRPAKPIAIRKSFESARPFMVDDHDVSRIKLTYMRDSIAETLTILDKCGQVNDGIRQ